MYLLIRFLILIDRNKNHYLTFEKLLLCLFSENYNVIYKLFLQISPLLVILLSGGFVATWGLLCHFDRSEDEAIWGFQCNVTSEEMIQSIRKHESKVEIVLIDTDILHTYVFIIYHCEK